MGIKVGEFFIDLAVDAASGNLSVKQLIGAMGELEVASLGGTYGVAKIAESFYELAKSAMGASVDLLALQDVTGADPKMVQGWQMAGEKISISAGAIRNSIKSVGDTMAAISQMKASPPELLTRFGIIPSMSKDAGKVYSDLMQKISNNKDFWSVLYGPRERVNFLKTMGLGEEDLRILQEMRAGRWHPESVQGLTKKQMEEFKQISQVTINIQQLMRSIADNLLTDGGVLLSVLERARLALQEIDIALHTKGDGGRSDFGYFVKGLGQYLNPSANKLLPSAFLSPLQANPRFATAATTAAVQADFGTLNVKVTGPRGEGLGEHKFRIDRTVKNRNTEDASLNLNLEGK